MSSRKKIDLFFSSRQCKHRVPWLFVMQSHTAPERRRCPLSWCWRKIRIPPESWLNADHFYQSKKTLLQTYWSQRLIFFQRPFSNLLLWKKISSISRIIFLLLVLCFMLLYLCFLFKKFLQFESPRLFLHQNKGCRSDFFTSRPKFSPGWCMALTHSFSESALNKESGGICFFFQHQNTGQSWVQ